MCCGKCVSRFRARTVWGVRFPALSKHHEPNITSPSHTHTHSHTISPSVSLPHTHSLPLLWSKRAEVRGEWLWERGGPAVRNCHHPDKLTCNINKHAYIRRGQYPREESTIPSTTPHKAWNNTTHTEPTPQSSLSQHGTGQSLVQHHSVSSTTQCMQWETIHQVLTQLNLL